MAWLHVHHVKYLWPSATESRVTHPGHLGRIAFRSVSYDWCGYVLLPISTTLKVHNLLLYQSHLDRYPVISAIMPLMSACPSVRPESRTDDARLDMVLLSYLFPWNWYEPMIVLIEARLRWLVLNLERTFSHGRIVLLQRLGCWSYVLNTSSCR